MPAALAFFQLANYLEAALWILIATGCAVAALRAGGITRRNCAIAAVAFCFFGISDIIEADTGAWYRPWWLLVWKAACLAVLAWLLAQYIRERRKAA